MIPGTGTTVNIVALSRMLNPRKVAVAAPLLTRAPAWARSTFAAES